jgi:signal transduction histidine kinase
MIDLLCTVLELLLLALSVAISRKSEADDKGNGMTQRVVDTQEEVLEFVDCTVCGKANQVGRVSCSACGALQGTART